MPSSNLVGLSSSVIYPKKGEGPFIVPSTFGYASGYTEAKSVPKQIEILTKTYPFLYFRDTPLALIDTEAVRDGAEGKFVIPHWATFARTYTAAILVALEGLKETMGVKIYHYCHGKIGSRNFLRGYDNELALRSLCGEKNEWWNTVYTISAQFGVHYRGASPYWVKRSLRDREFGLGLFEGIIMLVTHPERLSSDNDLWIEFPGDSFSPDPKGEPTHTPFINIINGEIGIGTSLSMMPGARYGSATWFMP